MAEKMSKLTEDEQKKLLALTPEQARVLFASSADSGQSVALFPDLPSRFTSVTLCGMSAILKDEEFVAVETAVKAGVAPQPVRKK